MTSNVGMRIVRLRLGSHIQIPLALQQCPAPITVGRGLLYRFDISCNKTLLSVIRGRESGLEFVSLL